MRVLYRQSASDDVVRQFRYYLVNLDLPDLAVRFKDSVRRTIQSLQKHPFVGSRYQTNSPKLQNLRSWPVVGFEAIRVYYLIDQDVLRIVRILHGRRNIRHTLELEEIM